MAFFGKWKLRAEELEREKQQLGNVVSDLQAFKDRFKNIADADEEARRIIADAKAARSEAMRIKKSAELIAADITSKSEARQAELSEVISQQEAQMEENLQTLCILGTRAMLVEDLDIDPKVALSESEREIRRLDEQLKRLGKPDAIFVNYNFQYNGSKAEGRKFQNQIKRLAKLSFDGQCRNIIKAITANNGGKAGRKVREAAVKINSFTTMVKVHINSVYVDLKVAQANMACMVKIRAARRKEVEREEREILRKERQLERENKQLIKDAEKAARDESKALEMLAMAKVELAKAHGDKMASIQDQVSRLQEALGKAHARNVRAKSMAQITKAGHVYIISNRGSFGEGVYKIGLTRRLDPEDRVRELGDASVPFKFDTHAMIWSEDAPALETKLHSVFAKRRVNLVNRRREFFRISLEEIRQELHECGFDADVRTTVAQEEYRESKRIWSLLDNTKSVTQLAMEEAARGNH
jgi:hypothetical protein